MPGSKGNGGLLPTTTWILVGGVILIVAALYSVNAFTAEHPWVNHDVAYHSYLGLEMVRGSDLYVELKEDNPPGSPLLLGGLVALSDLLGIPDFLSQHLLVLLLGVVGLSVLRAALPGPRDDLRFSLVALAYLIVIVRGNFSNNLYLTAPDIPYDFGQREHLFSLLFLPYLIYRITRDTIPRVLYPWLLLLGFVAVFKPYWPLMIAAVEAYRLADRQTRSWVVPAALGAGMVLPFFLLLLHSTASFLTFFGENVPTFFTGGYTYYDTGLAEFATSALHQQMIGGSIFLAAGLALCWHTRQMRRRTLGLLLLLAGVAYLSVLHQHKFWSYHAMTFFGACLVPGAFLLGAALSGTRRVAVRALATILAFVVATAFAGATVSSTAKMLRDYPPLGYFLAPLIEPYPKVMFFSMSVETSYAPLLLRKEMIGPFTVFLDLPAILALPDAARRDRILEDYVAEVVDVIATERPDLLVFSPNRQALSSGDRKLHDILLPLGAVPSSGYQRVPQRLLRDIDSRFGGWVVYRRTAEI